MSWQAVADVLENSSSYGADRLVELAIAERADEFGAGSRGSMEDVARRANLLRFREVAKPSDAASDAEKVEFERLRGNAARSARRSVRKLESLGRVEHYETTLKGVRVYRVCLGRTPCPGEDMVSGVERAREDTVSSLPGHGDLRVGTTCPPSPDTVSSKPSLNPPSKSEDEPKQHPSSISDDRGSRISLVAVAAGRKQELHRRVEREADLRELETLREQLPMSRHPGQTRRSIEILERELGLVSDDPAIASELASWSDWVGDQLLHAASQCEAVAA